MTQLAAMEREIAALESALRDLRPCAVVDRVPFCPHTPTPPQRRFLETDTLEAFYGGGAGGGKSDALIMAALQFVDRPDYAALLLRRSFPDLRQPGALMDRAHTWLAGSGAEWKETDRRWTFPSGATLTFGYAESLADIVRAYQGAEYQFIGIDELGQWREAEYRYLLSRVRRRAGSRVPLRMRAAGNPGGIGHAWVKPRFISPGDPSRPFVPALAGDNPHLDVEAYRVSLAVLDSKTRDQLEHGSWVDDVAGRVYWAFNRARDMCSRLPEGERLHYVLAIDLGASEEKPTTAFVLLAWSESSHVVFVVRSWTMAGGSPQSISNVIASTREVCPIERIVVDAGALGAGYLRDFQTRFGEAARAAEKRDKLGTRRLLNGECERERVKVLEGENDELVSEIETLRFAEDGLDADPKQPDHVTDAWLYGWRDCYGWAATLPPAALSEQERQAREERELEQARIRSMTEQEEEW